MSEEGTLRLMDIICRYRILSKKTPYINYPDVIKCYD